MQNLKENLMAEREGRLLIKALSSEEDESLNKLFFQETVLNNLSALEKASYINLLLRQDAWISDIQAFYKTHIRKFHLPRKEIGMHVTNPSYLKTKPLQSARFHLPYTEISERQQIDFTFWGIITLCLMMLALLIFW